jgi:hypothetical protein
MRVVVVDHASRASGNSGGSALFGYDTAQDNRSQKVLRVMKIVFAVLVAAGALLLVTM